MAKRNVYTPNIRRNLFLLFAVFLVGFSVQAVLNFSIDNFISSLDQKARNAEVQNQLGNEILLEIDTIEISFFKLAAFPNKHLRRIITDEIKESQGEILEALEVLNKGGTYLHHLELNLPNTPSLEETFEFMPTQPNHFEFAKADVISKFQIINDSLVNLTQRLAELDRLRHNNSADLAEKVTQFKLELKFISPIFHRLRENANQIFYENHVDVRNIQKDISQKKQAYHDLQIFIVILVGLIVIYLFWRLIRNISLTSQQIEDGQDYVQEILNSQSNIIVVNDGENILDVSGGFFAFFSDYNTVDEFQKDFSCVCDLFVKEEGYIQKEMGKQSWVEYLVDRPGEHHKVKVNYKNKISTFKVSVIKSERYQRFVISMFDISDIELINQKLEIERNKALAATAAKGDFLANMSHEIRTPLNGIVGFIDLLREKKYDEETDKYLETISLSSHSLLGVINDILDFSKIESGKLEIDPVVFNPQKEFRSTADLFSTKCSEKNINFIVSLDASLPRALKSDILRIKQVMNNLLSNAIKFTDPGKNICFKVFYDKDRKELTCQIEDQGIGISHDKLDHIFDSFTQAESSTTRKYGGTGLGLAISSKLIEMLGGQIHVTSELNQGSCFAFTIPVETAVKSTTIDIEKELSNNFNGHLLLVEDNKTNQMLMGAILKKFGVTFDLAEDGEQAIEEVKHHQYDMILMDENMPNMNGIVATRHIRDYEIEKGISPKIIVALTANAMKGDKERFLNAGMNDYLSKPIDLKELQRVFTLYLTKIHN